VAPVIPTHDVVVDGPVKTSKEPVCELKIINPKAGLTIRFRSVEFILGKSNPLDVELISRIEEASGLVVPIPTCANTN
jgi:hypothetical protein